jgi:hypothetical protein
VAVALVGKTGGKTSAFLPRLGFNFVFQSQIQQMFIFDITNWSAVG